MTYFSYDFYKNKNLQRHFYRALAALIILSVGMFLFIDCFEINETYDAPQHDPALDLALFFNKVKEIGGNTFLCYRGFFICDFIWSIFFVLTPFLLVLKCIKSTSHDISQKVTGWSFRVLTTLGFLAWISDQAENILYFNFCDFSGIITLVTLKIYLYVIYFVIVVFILVRIFIKK